jgi:NADH-quinone oxidoreductase subunit J
MSFIQLLFIFFSVVAIGAAVRVVTCVRIFHAAMWLIASFFGVAAIYMMLESPFMAGIQLFIYIGGVAVLTVISIMVTKGVMRQDKHTLNDPLSAAAVSLALFGVMVWMILQIPLPLQPAFPVVEDDLTLLGLAMVDADRFLLPFEITSIMLLTVLIGSLYLGRER